MFCKLQWLNLSVESIESFQLFATTELFRSVLHFLILRQWSFGDEFPDPGLPGQRLCEHLTLLAFVVSCFLRSLLHTGPQRKCAYFSLEMRVGDNFTYPCR